MPYGRICLAVVSLIFALASQSAWSKGGGGGGTATAQPSAASNSGSTAIKAAEPMPPLPVVPAMTPPPSPPPKIKQSLWAKTCRVRLPAYFEQEVADAQLRIAADSKSHSGEKAANADESYASQKMIEVFRASFKKFSGDFPEGSTFPDKADKGGNEKIRTAYDNFSQAGSRFKSEIKPGGRIFQLAQKCTHGRQQSDSGALASQVELTKRFMLSRYRFTVAAHQAHAAETSGAQAHLAAKLEKATEIALKDVEICPATFWEQAKIKFLKLPHPSTASGTAPCNSEDFGHYQHAVTESFDRLVHSLKVR